ncbi:MAG: hypothetical protein ACI8YQ_001139 [Polaribacter sp.]|jgi:hypothetical protein
MTSKTYFKALVLTLLIATNLNAQNFPYYFSIDEQPYVEIEGTDLIGDTWDDPEFQVPIGFEFLFLGEPISDFYQVGTGAILTGNSDFDYSTDVDAFSIYGSDIIDIGYDTTTVSRISYALEGNPGNQICKIEWKDVGFYEDIMDPNPTNSTLNFQAWFYEGSHTIEIRFGPNDIILPDSTFHDFGGDPFIGMFEGIDNNAETIENLYYISGAEGTATVTDVNDPSFYDLEDISSLTSNPIDGRVYRFTTAPFVNTKEPGLSQLVKIYPSLATDFTLVNINQQNFTTAKIQIINQLGQTVLQQAAHSGAQRLDLSNFTSGTYFVRVQIDGEEFSQAILKR